MLISPLFLADQPAWRKESGYSQTVSAALYRVYAVLAHASSQTAPWLEIRQVLMKVIVQRMARPQRRNISFLMGLAHASLALYPEALAFFEDACDISVELEDVPAIADITFLCGCLERDQLHLSAATNYFEIALAAFQELTDSTQPENPDNTFNTLTQLAFATFYQEQFDETAAYLQQARDMLPRLSSEPQGKADISWIEALLNRWRGDTSNGLQQALDLVDVIAQQAGPPSVVRAKLLVADIALDRAESRLPDERDDANNFLALATPYVRSALALAETAQDQGGLGLAMLAEARLSRLAGRESPRIATIEAVFSMAQQLGDIALLAQSQTALGDEFRYSGEKEASLMCYRATLDALEPSDIPALGVWARRQLLFATEACYE